MARRVHQSVAVLLYDETVDGPIGKNREVDVMCLDGSKAVLLEYSMLSLLAGDVQQGS